MMLAAMCGLAGAAADGAWVFAGAVPGGSFGRDELGQEDDTTANPVRMARCRRAGHGMQEVGAESR